MTQLLMCYLPLGLMLVLPLPPASQPKEKEISPSEITFRAAWLPVADIKPGECKLLHAPFIVVQLKNEGEQTVEDAQGDPKKKSERENFFISKGAIRIIGKDFPMRARIKYEFEDNKAHHFVIKGEVSIHTLTGVSALASSDGKGVLFIYWDVKL